MAAPDPEHVGFLVKNMDAIVTGAVVLLLAVLRFLGRKDAADTATAIVTEKPLTHAEVDAKLLRCQITVQESINQNFKDINDSVADFRKEFMQEVRALHIRLNNEGK